MKVDYNSRLQAEQVIEHGYTGNRYNWTDTYYVCKYMIHVWGYGKARTYTEICKFITKNDPYINLDAAMGKFRQSIHKMINQAYRFDFSDDWHDIVITRSEVDDINKFRDIDGRKVLFTMLVICKMRSKPSNKFYMKKFPLVKKYSGIRHTPHKLFKMYAHAFHLSGHWGEMYNVGKGENQDVAIVLPYYNAEDEVELIITKDDMDNLGNLFPQAAIKPVCEDCGNEYDKKSRNHSKCPDCYAAYRTLKKCENQKIRRSLNKK